jgi:peptidoglycan-N-acetylglucosamine deacetylase
VLAAKRCTRMVHQLRYVLTRGAINFSIVAIGLVATINVVFGAGCPGNPDAIGTSRVLTISPQQFSRIGSMQYNQALPLNDHEVVLTFDDGPLPPFSDIILKILDSQCVRATHFLIGKTALMHPDVVRRIYNAGQTVGTHSFDHPVIFRRLPSARVEAEVGDGIKAVSNAIGDPKAVAPFFRIPGLGRSTEIDNYLASQSLVTWSADVVADDWFHHITPTEIVDRAIKRLDAKGSGILLLHEIHPATALALPLLLKELKDRGYHVVHVVPAGDLPNSVPDLPGPSTVSDGGWPRAVMGNAHHRTNKLAIGKIQ